MAIEVFNRYEKKYIIDEDTFHKLTYQIADYMNPDAYNRNGEAYRISNIYYDTENDQLIRASIEKPVYKEKLRLRAYGTPELIDNVFVEIKKKYDGIVNKRRTSMTLQEAYDFLDDDLCPDGDFRITFDKNITTRREDVRLEHGSYGNKLLPDGQYLMEVKISGAVPLWFAKIISGLNIYPISFSKYGTEYKQYVLSNYTSLMYKGENLCLNQYLHQQQIMQSALVRQ